MDCSFLLDVVIGEGPVVLELLSSKDETLLIRWDCLLVLYLTLEALDGISWLDVEGDVLSCESSNKDLHSFELEVGLVLYIVLSM